VCLRWMCGFGVKYRGRCAGTGEVLGQAAVVLALGMVIGRAVCVGGNWRTDRERLVGLCRGMEGVLACPT